MNIFKFGRILFSLFVLAMVDQAYAYTANDYYQAGLSLYSSHNYTQAIKYFGATLSLDPNNTSALQGQANCYYSLGQYQQALSDYQKVQALAPSDQMAQFINKVQAIVNASSTSSASPAGSDYFSQGMVYFQQKQYANSIQFFQQACRQYPGNYKPYYYLGIAYVNLEDYKDGAAALGICNLKYPSAAIQAYINTLKGKLSPDDDQWVDAQISAAGGNNFSSSTAFNNRNVQSNAKTASAKVFAPQYSLNLSLSGINLMTPSSYSYSSSVPSLGVGASLFADYRPFEWISFGLGASYSDFPGTTSFSLSSIDLGGRLFPFSWSPSGEFFLLGGLGLNISPENPDNFPSGHYHGFAGLGYRFIFDTSNALDLGAQYDYFSPFAAPLQEIGLKVGWTFLFNTN